MPKRVVKCICSSSTSNLPKNNLQTNKSKPLPNIDFDTENIEEPIDWRTLGAVTYVKD